jgi:hypothetical protein
LVSLNEKENCPATLVTSGTRATLFRSAANGQFYRLAIGEQTQEASQRLSVVPSRHWALGKKILGKHVYFGKIVDDPKGERALALWMAQKDDLLAGRAPRAKDDDSLFVSELANQFLTAKKHDLDVGELSPRTFRDYYDACALVVKAFGGSRSVKDLRPDDFARLKRRFPKT